MSMWDLFCQTVRKQVDRGECAPPVGVNMNMFDKVDSDSIRPFEAECIVGVVTHRGLAHKFTKPKGSYDLCNRDAMARIRQRKAQEFVAIIEADQATEEYFAETFSADIWEEAPANSEVRVTSKRPPYWAVAATG